MTLGSTDQDFVCDNIDLLGVNIDSKLTFDKQVLVVCSNVNKQLQVIKRFKGLVSRKTRQRVYNAFINWRSNIVAMCGTTAAHVVKISSNSLISRHSE